MPKVTLAEGLVDYKLFVTGLVKLHPTEEQNYLHGPVGVAKEAGELLDNAYRHWNYGKPHTAETALNVLEEAGDILFYLQATLNTIDMTIEDALQANVIKLWKRYPNGYTDEKALARLDKEPGK